MNAGKLTVVQLLPELDVGGVERGTIEVARALVERGHRAIVVCRSGRMTPALLQTGAEHVPWPIGGKTLRTLRFVPQLRRLFEREHVDVVHARSRLPAWIGCLALRAIPPARRPRWVTTVHGPYTVNRYSRIMITGESVIAISEFIRDYVVSSYPGVDRDRIAVIPRGVDRRSYPFGYEPSSEWLRTWHDTHPQLIDKKILSIAARLTRWKGQEDFVSLIKGLLDGGLAVHGLIAGGSHPRKRAFEKELRGLVGDWGLCEHVSFLDHRSDVREVLAISDVACSLTHEPEAFGRTTIEALSLGTPVLGYDHGGTGEILQRVYPAGLVRVRDIHDAVTVAARLLNDAPPVPRAHPYTLDQMLDKTVALYEGLADRQRGVQSE